MGNTTDNVRDKEGTADQNDFRRRDFDYAIIEGLAGRLFSTQETEN